MARSSRASAGIAIRAFISLEYPERHDSTRYAAFRADSWAARSSASSSGSSSGRAPVAALERQGDQVVGEPGVLRQQRAVQVGADQVVAPHALEAVVAVVAEAAERPARAAGRRGRGRCGRRGSRSRRGSAAPPPSSASIATLPISRGPGSRTVSRSARPEPRQGLLAELVAVAEQLVAAADGEQDGAVVDRGGERLALGLRPCRRRRRAGRGPGRRRCRRGRGRPGSTGSPAPAPA